MYFVKISIIIRRICKTFLAPQALARFWPGVVHPSPAAALDSAALLATSYRVEPDLIYLSVGGWNGKLDVYLPRRPNGSNLE